MEATISTEQEGPFQGATVSLCDAKHGQLVIVDVQERLAAAIPQESLNTMIRGSTLLLDAASILGIPTLCTEQYPEGLGATVSAITEHLPASIDKIAKTCFSCTGAEAFQQAITDSRRKQVILAGMEAHVCILQTAMQLKQQGQEVFVVEDAVCSRGEEKHRNAMQRMRQAGIIVSNTESVIFEWLRDAKHEQFRNISALLK